MIYFSARSKARNFAKGTKKLIDLGKTSPKRWAVRVL